MGKIEYLFIELDKVNPIYFSEETITGTLKVRVKERFKINGIYLDIVGGARVHWTETRKSGKRTYTVSYSGYEKYMEHRIQLMAKDQNQDLYLEFGDYNLKFQILLPARLPTSFEHMIGKIRYSLHACVDIPWSFNKRSERAFTVLSDYDLNLHPVLRTSYGVSDSKVLCCGPCKSEPILAKFDIPKTGFVSGESIFFNASIDNKSNSEIRDMNISIIQVIKFHATTKTKRCERLMVSIKYLNKIPKRSYENWSSSILIPPMIHTSNGFCRIIDISYLVQFDFTPSGTLLSKKLFIPIVIGTRPLMDISTNQSGEGELYSSSLPSYEACVQDQPVGMENIGFEQNGKNDEIFQSGGNEFRPLYPYFNDYFSSSKKY